MSLLTGDLTGVEALLRDEAVLRRLRDLCDRGIRGVLDDVCVGGGEASGARSGAADATSAALLA